MTSDPFLNAMREIVGVDNVLTLDGDTQPYTADARNRYPGQARAVVRPANTGEVVRVVQECNAGRVAIVPQGGNTGLAGSSTPDRSGREIVLSLRRMNRVRHVSPHDNAVTVEAGCILQHVQELAQENDRLFPLSLAAEGSATIGGNLATNAGGEQVLRYGNTRDLTLGLEVVLPDGRVLDGLSPLRKDNTGYDLKHLFIGSEGTLGIITAASMKLYPRPRQQSTVWLGIESPSDAVVMLTYLRDALGDRITAFELMRRETLEQVLRHIPATRDPLPTPTPWAVLVEVSEATADSDLRGQIESVLGHALEQSWIIDAALAESSAQADAMWHLRDHVPEAQKRDGASIKHDISVPISRVPEFIDKAGEALQKAFPGIRVICFGHVGDGNLHYNQSKPYEQSDADFWAQEEGVHHLVHELVVQMGGSISAEHGIGRYKQEAFLKYKSPVALDLMYAIKQAIDPSNLLNPGRMLAVRE